MDDAAMDTSEMLTLIREWLPILYVTIGPITVVAFSIICKRDAPIRTGRRLGSSAMRRVMLSAQFGVRARRATSSELLQPSMPPLVILSLALGLLTMLSRLVSPEARALALEVGPVLYVCIAPLGCLLMVICGPYFEKPADEEAGRSSRLGRRTWRRAAIKLGASHSIQFAVRGQHSVSAKAPPKASSAGAHYSMMSLGAITAALVSLGLVLFYVGVPLESIREALPVVYVCVAPVLCVLYVSSATCRERAAERVMHIGERVMRRTARQFQLEPEHPEGGTRTTLLRPSQTATVQSGFKTGYAGGVVGAVGKLLGSPGATGATGYPRAPAPAGAGPKSLEKAHLELELQRSPRAQARLDAIKELEAAARAAAPAQIAQGIKPPPILLVMPNAVDITATPSKTASPTAAHRKGPPSTGSIKGSSPKPAKSVGTAKPLATGGAAAGAVPAAQVQARDRSPNSTTAATPAGGGHPRVAVNSATRTSPPRGNSMETRAPFTKKALWPSADAASGAMMETMPAGVAMTVAAGEQIDPAPQALHDTWHESSAIQSDVDSKAMTSYNNSARSPTSQHGVPKRASKEAAPSFAPQWGDTRKSPGVKPLKLVERDHEGRLVGAPLVEVDSRRVHKRLGDRKQLVEEMKARNDEAAKQLSRRSPKRDGRG